MKKIFLFAIACLALLAACNKNETTEPAPQPQEMTITLGAPAMGTKTVLTPTGSGNIGFKQEWKVGDAIMLLYLHKDISGLTKEKFVCTEVNLDGSAKFTCDASQITTATTSGSQVNIVYPYSSVEYSFNPGIDLRDFDGTLASLPDYCIFNALSTIHSGGTIDAVTKFNNDVVILRIPAGTLLVNGASGNENINIAIGAVEAGKIGYQVTAKNSQVMSATNNAGQYVYNLSASMTNGVLDNDVYAVWYHHSSWGACSLNINVICNSGTDHFYNLASHDFAMGKVYTLSQTTLNAGHGGVVCDY